MYKSFIYIRFPVFVKQLRKLFSMYKFYFVCIIVLEQTIWYIKLIDYIFIDWIIVLREWLNSMYLCMYIYFPVPRLLHSQKEAIWKKKGDKKEIGLSIVKVRVRVTVSLWRFFLQWTQSRLQRFAALFVSSNFLCNLFSRITIEDKFCVISTSIE